MQQGSRCAHQQAEKEPPVSLIGAKRACSVCCLQLQPAGSLQSSQRLQVYMLIDLSASGSLPGCMQAAASMSQLY